MDKSDSQVRVVSLATLRDICAASAGTFFVASVSRSRVTVKATVPSWKPQPWSATATFPCYPGETRDNPRVVLAPMHVTNDGDDQAVNIFAPLVNFESKRAPAHGAVIMVCETCGSDDVKADAYGVWSVPDQCWELPGGDVFDNKICEHCAATGDGETNLEELSLSVCLLVTSPGVTDKITLGEFLDRQKFSDDARRGLFKALMDGQTWTCNGIRVEEIAA